MTNYYTVTFNFKDGTSLTDIPVMKQGFRLSRCVGSKGRHAQQSCTVSIRRQDAVTKMLGQSDYIDAKVYAGAELFFEGVIKPFLTISGKNGTGDPLSIEILDYSETMHKQVAVDLSRYGIVEGGKMVTERVWHDIAAQDLLSELFALTDVTEKVTLSFPDFSSKRFDFFMIKDGDDLEEVIERTLYELCYDYRFVPGKILIFPIALTGEAPLLTTFVNQMKVSKKGNQKNGIKIQWPVYGEMDCKIYEDDTSFSHPSDFTTIASGSQKTGIYYENSMHEGETVPPDRYTARWNWKFLQEAKEGAEAVRLTDVVATCELVDEKGVETAIHYESWDLNGARLYVNYDGWFDTWFGTGWGFHITAKGHVTYRVTKENAKYTEKCTNPEAVTARYVDSAPAAEKFARTLYQIQQGCVYHYTFSSFQKFEPGDFLRIQEKKVLGVTADVRIISVDWNEEADLYTYEAEGAAALGDVPLFSLPETSGSVGQPQSSSGVTIHAERTFFIAEEGARKAKVWASGFAVTARAQIKWELNGTPVAKGENEILIDTSLLMLGVNYLTCYAVLDGRTYSDRLALSLAKADNSTRIEYKWSASQTSFNTQASLWYWQGIPMFIGDGMISEYDDFSWNSAIPEQPEEKPFLWMRVSVDGGATWAYSCITGSDGAAAVDFTINPVSETFILGSRGMTLKPQLLSFDLVRMNTVAEVIWTVEPAEYADPDQPVGDRYTVLIPLGVSLDHISVTAEILGIGKKTVTVNGVRESAPKGEYFGVVANLSVLMQMQADGKAPTGEPLYDGDSFVVIVDTNDGKRGPVPYVWNALAGEFRLVDARTPNYSQIMGSALGDILNTPDTKLVEAAQYAFFGQLASNAAFIRRLLAHRLEVGEGTGQSGSGFRFRALQDYDESGAPVGAAVFDVMWGNRIVFKVVPDTGRVFIGQPNATLDAPLSGFMYDPYTDAIVTKGNSFKLDSNGNIVLNNTQLNGSFNCSSIYTDEAMIRESSCSSAVNNAEQGKNYYERWHSTFGDGFVRCSIVGGNPDVKYCRLAYRPGGGGWLGGDSWSLDFFDESRNPCNHNLAVTFVGVEPAYYYYDSVSTNLVVNNYQGAYITNGFTLKIYKGGNILRLDIPMGPSAAEIGTYPFGQMYALADGTVKMATRK